jgi:hypothetical protein
MGTVYATQTEYAKHRGLSQARVSQMIKAKKIPSQMFKK